MCIFPHKVFWSPMLAPEALMEIHKALSHSPSQPPMRTEVKPYSFQPPNLPQWIGKTREGGPGIYRGPEKWAVFLELDGTNPGCAS